MPKIHVFYHKHPENELKRHHDLEEALEGHPVVPCIGQSVPEKKGDDEWRIYDRELYPERGVVAIILCPKSSDTSYFRRMTSESVGDKPSL